MIWRLLGAFILVIVGYLMMPFGDVTPKQVVKNFTASKSSFYGFDKEDYKEDFTEIHKTGEYLLPVTGYNFDKSQKKDSDLSLTAWYKYNDGSSHKALDFQNDPSVYYPQPQSGLSCKGDSDCRHTYIPAPIDGTIQSVKYPVNGSTSVTPYVRVQGKAGTEFEGVVFSMMHMSNIPEFSVGDEVKRGDYLGVMCNQGNSSGSHTHFFISFGSSTSYPQSYEDYIDMLYSYNIALDETIKDIKNYTSYSEDAEKLIASIKSYNSKE